ncbi:MAG TPA: fibronectin type III domain-containing protein [Tepidisphaeraceae bacterium]|nr:fibronectin type III domain-containing protein [Tepidisphaeraceae bacterium]
MFRVLSPVVEKLEERHLLSADPLAYQNLVQPLPYSLNFNSPQNGVFDTNGQGTGFTLVQPNRLGTQYQPSLVHLNTAASELDLTTQGTSASGSNYGTDNTMVNGLETKFDATTSGFSITARLKGPLSQFTANYDGAGVFFGPDDDNYVKFVAEYDSTKGQTLQFLDEQNATLHTVNNYQSIGSFSNVATLDLRLTGDAGTGIVTASYSVNGAAFAGMPGAVNLTGAERTAFFNSAGIGGILAITRNNLPQITVPFGHFEIDPGQSAQSRPSIRFTTPMPNATSVAVDQPIEADLNLPNSAINAQTISDNTVYLYRSSDKSIVPAVVNTSGGGDSIILTPDSVLAPSTQYTFVVTSGVQDTTGAAIVPYSMTFTTGVAQAQPSPTIGFQQVDLASATGAAFTGVKIGPDGKLYAATEDGRLFRWAINSDGTLGTPQIFNSLQRANGGQNRLITGFAFDPASTAANPILWVANSFYALSGSTNGVDFTGKITVISGPNLATVQDAVVNLPRSIADHSTEQPTFGPDGSLYFAQASNTAYGAPDSTWGNRTEHLLTAAILRLDTSKLNLANGPLNVLTPDVGGTYNPYAAGAPLTIYATGVRNAFSLLWTNDGKLYAPNNGSSSGGNTPAYNAGDPSQINGNRIDTGQPYTGINVPGLTNVQQTESDYLYNIVQGGYYGHPNPYRGEYVLNGGNPSTGGIADEVFSAYPSGTNPDPNYRGIAWDFGDHASADRIIQYQDKTFGGQLQNALLVTEYSAGSDIVVLQRDSSGNVISETKGIAGLTSLNNPLSLVEDPSNGNIYVSELGGLRIMLLRPIAAKPIATPGQSVLAFNSVAAGHTGAGAGKTQTVALTNTGNLPLALSSILIVNDPSVSTLDSADFKILNAASLPASVAPGQAVTIQLQFAATRVGIESALLQIQSNDPATPVLKTNLHGIGTAGLYGYLEPSLVQVLRANNIPTIVGAGPNDVNGSNSQYPINPDSSSQEVPMQRLVKAGDGPVTITPLASFDSASQPVLRFGFYTPGNATDRTELFTIAQADAQTVNPTALGATSFDPGSNTFGLWANFPGTTTPNGKPDFHYSEDLLNTQDPTHPRKFRFFPLENADGTIVPNAYVLAAEDYDSTAYNSFINFVGIIRNVMPAANAVGAPALGVANLDAIPYSDRMVFNRIQVPNPVVNDIVHDTGSLQLSNSGSQPLVINALTLSDSTNWELLNPPTLPYSIAPGATLTLTVKFIAQAAPSHSDNQTNDTAVANDPGYTPLTGGGVWNGTLAISTNDPANPNKAITLAGWWQHLSEHEEEPGLQTMLSLLYGYQINTGNPSTTPDYTQGATPVYYGEEINSPYWNVADTTAPVTVRQLASYHNQLDANNNLTAAFFGYFPMGSSTTKYLFGNAKAEGQSLLPTIYGGSSTAPAQSSFIPTSSAFGFTLDGEYTLDSLNTAAKAAGRSGHDVRLYPVRDRNGNLVPNTYIAGLDYGGGTYENWDFQDNVYLITNVKPYASAPVPLDAQANAAPGAGVNIQWAPVASSTLQGYNIYRGTSNTGPFTKLNAAPITAASYFDAQAPAGVTSYYRITSVDGNGESLGANASSPAIPVAPYGLAASAVNAGSINLSWYPVAGTTDYRVEREILGGSGFVEVGTASTAAYTDSGLLGSTNYVYRIRAENGAGLGTYSNVAVAVTPSGIAPGAPTNLQGSANANNQIILTWSAPATGSVTAYHVERMGPGETVFTEIAGNVSGLTFTDTQTSGGATYQYRVRAESAGTLGAYSNTANATTGIAIPFPPAAPANVSANAGSSSQVVLNWSPVPKTESYIIQRQVQGDSTWTTRASAYLGGTSYIDSGLQASTTYIYQVAAQNLGGASSFAQAQVTTTASAPAYQSADIASTPLGSTVENVVGASYDITAGGTDIGSTAADGFRFVYQQITGDFDAVMQVQSLVNTFSTNKAGLMVRTTLDPGSPMVFDGATSASSYRFLYRNAMNATAVFSANGPVVSYPNVWVRLVRKGNLFTGYYSADGLNWGATGNVNLALPTTVYFGMAVTSHNPNTTTTAQIRNLSVFAAPPAPQLSVQSTTAGAVSLGWNNIVTASSYNVLRLNSATNTYTQIATGITATSYQDTGLSAGASYQYEVVAINSVGASAASNTVTAQTSGNVPTAPGAISLTSSTTSSLSISWAPSTGVVTEYRVERMGPGESAFHQVSAAGLTATSFTDTGLSAGQAYQYRVLAANGAGTSGYSGPVTFTTQTAQTGPGQPGQPVATANGPYNVSLTWAAPSGAVTGYQILRSTNGGSFAQIANTTDATYVDAQVQPNTTCAYEVIAQDAGQTGPPSIASAAITTPASAFNTADISAAPAGSTSVVTEGSAYNMTAGGTGFAGTSDSFRFLYTQLTGDFNVIVQVAGVSAVSGAYGQAGLMARASLDASSPEVALTISPQGGYRSTSRAAIGSAIAQTQAGYATFPNCWLRLQRVGNTFTTWCSQHGTAWYQISSVTLDALPSTLYVGMAAASDSAAATTTAQFQNLAGL